MTERRQTRLSARLQKEEKSSSIRLTKEANINKFKIQLNAIMSNADKQKNLSFFKQKYLWEYEIWEDYLLKCIENKNLEMVLYYLENNKKVYNYACEMSFMTDIFDKMRDMDVDFIFWDRPYLNKLKGEIEVMPKTEWWENHIINSLNNSNYIYKLLNNEWDFITQELLMNYSYEMPEQTSKYIIDKIYKEEEFKYQYWFSANNNQQKMLELLYTKNNKYKLTKENKINQLNYLKYLIQKRRTVLPPLKINIYITNTGKYNITEHNLEEFILTCIKNNEIELLQEITKTLNIKLDTNDLWFKYLLECIVRPKYLFLHEGNTCNIEDSKLLVSFILKYYKININNVYMLIRDNLPQLEVRDPIRHPKLWLDKNLPAIAWAILYDNMDAIHYLIKEGAKLNRCAISMQDLTINPKILGLFTRESKASKIQTAYLKHYYAPLPSEPINKKSLTKYQSRKLEGIERRAAAKQALFMQSIKEQQTANVEGGKKKQK